ncbi:uncharacterized protein TRIADDRAFT_53121 [Trichoplax adhaerens]|uniref:Microsomal glutathione S-transferase 1 n=1 Tax=Trichoplax adhaerens TaxID=10228 RepID=B3RND1_TRIAD|nr:hypothetical protein TRIADDRAFT_53121 [Trichoplax adhaerens]EDV27433.1 hypothetical protein TRIADDRAFT_53121 [Trichoplax adhaerens]|eukprot:XP_002109267.1 hypothetical protein TRIADDRAFT_53121 [Trichoplax adhaerens]
MDEQNQLLSFSNPVFNAYAFYAVIIVLKVLTMAVNTGRLRQKNTAFSNPEDAILFGIEPSKKNVNVKHPDVERFVRAHRNDLENIISFLFVGFLYVLTDPPYDISIYCFRIFTLARIIHSVSSVKVNTLLRYAAAIPGME